MSKYLEIWNLSKGFPSPNGYVNVVEGFDLTLEKGEFVSLIGHSGCGKSTVLSIVAGLTEASGGGVAIAGREIDGAGPDRGVVFQAPCLLPWMTALENVLLGVDQVYPRLSRKGRVEIAEHVLERVGLAGSTHKRPGELSGGMRQRVGIARAFALSPSVLLLDEPFGMLDFLTRIELQQVLLDIWSQDRKTALMVTHDIDEALLLSDRIAMMTSGPRARVGEIVHVPFPRPRHHKEVLGHPDYYRLRERLIGFLEEQGGHHEEEEDEAPAPPAAATPPERELVAADGPGKS